MISRELLYFLMRNTRNLKRKFRANMGQVILYTSTRFQEEEKNSYLKQQVYK